ncbi:Hypothetical predicted protein [Olea europaea subsp. europaea]|uniref:Laminin G domain-containing protein n=1 Tax=Olea europaea subsp. europaea TaxID=158383 RepID=A0A8S0VMY2_OLEEU|nr:Hypothetical predicted protein [Olea europaea subsp. europaea]
MAMANQSLSDSEIRLIDVVERLLICSQFTGPLISKHPLKSTDSLVDQSKSAEEKSRVLKTISESQLMRVAELGLQMNAQNSNVNSLNNMLRAISKEEISVARQVDEMAEDSDSNVVGNMSRMNEVAYKYLDVSDKLFEEAAMLREHAQTELRPRLKLLSSEGSKNINLANEKINEAILTSKKVHETFTTLKNTALKQTEVFNAWNETITNDLAALRSKILEARHAADSIRLSLTSKKEADSCVRSYQPKLEPTTMTSIVLTYAIASQHRDALLFYLPSKTTEDFIAVEMVNRKIRLVWNLGGEPGEVTHPMHIQTAGDLGNDQHWYRIEAQR